MVKYIFLDFDGVLNAEDYQRQLKDLGITSFDSYGPLFKPEAVSNLKTIIDRTGAKVCITSSWAVEIGTENLPKFWKDRMMPGSLAGSTADISVDTDVFFEVEEFDPYKILEGGMGARGGEVKAFLEQKGALGSSYVILDDTPDFCKDQQPHFIQVNPTTGLTEDDAQKAIEILLANNL